MANPVTTSIRAHPVLWFVALAILLSWYPATLAFRTLQDNIAHSQTFEAVQLASGGKIPVTEYFLNHDAWPTDLSVVYDAAKQRPAGRFVESLTAETPSKGRYSIVATFKKSTVSNRLAGRAVAVWTSDGGRTWFCGPAKRDPIDVKYLASNCRDAEPGEL